MSPIDFLHSKNIHTQEGPRVVLPVIIELTGAKSILDVGCGVGNWLKAALEMGISDVFGVDGVCISPSELLIPADCFKVQDLTRLMPLGRKYDLALCLEVGEHLDAKAATVLIESLTAHADTVVFSAACPDQEGQNHINGQWPDYWQKLFNDRGFVCSDELRQRIWQDTRIEPWYRQNIFIARRASAGQAGQEPRIKSFVHPEIIQGIVNTHFVRQLDWVSAGGMPYKWYLILPLKVLLGRLKRMLNRGNT